jgi:hypothetical protein
MVPVNNRVARTSRTSVFMTCLLCSNPYPCGYWQTRYGRSQRNLSDVRKTNDWLSSRDSKRRENLNIRAAGQPSIEAGTLVGIPTKELSMSASHGSTTLQFLRTEYYAPQTHHRRRSDRVSIHRAPLHQRVCWLEYFSSICGSLGLAQPHALRVPYNHHPGSFDETRKGESFRMSSSAVSPSTKSETERKPYVAPAYQRLTPEAAKQVLLEKADVNDPEVRKMLRCIAELQKQNPAKPAE